MAPVKRWRSKVNLLKLLYQKSETVLRLKERLKAVEQELERSQQQQSLLAQLLESSSQPFVISYGDGHLALCNQAFCQLTGYSKAELATLDWNEDLTPAEWHAKESEYLQQIAATGQPLRYEKEYLHKDGHRVPVEVFVHQVSDERGQPAFYYGFATDITERQQMIRELEKHRNHLAELVEERASDLANILESISDAFFSLDFNWRFIYWNQGAEHLARIDRTEVLGKRIWDRFPELLPTELHSQLRKVMMERVAVHFETRSTPSEVWLDVHIYPSRSGISVFYRDISEVRCLEQEMARLTRLDLAGKMAASIGHEIRNPMTTVRGFLQFLGQKERYQQDKEFFDLMIDELDRANAIITEFLTLAKSRPEQPKLSDLRQEVAEVLPLIKADALLQGHNVELHLDETPAIMLDSKDIRQLVLNLVRNGFEAMESGTLTISTYASGSKVALAVTDQGPGIPAHVREKLGTPFFTTKDNGTGLGLAVCYKIAANHGATIEVDTGPGGTTFTVVFNIPTLSS